MKEKIIGLIFTYLLIGLIFTVVLYVFISAVEDLFLMYLYYKPMNIFSVLFCSIIAALCIKAFFFMVKNLILYHKKGKDQDANFKG